MSLDGKRLTGRYGRRAGGAAEQRAEVDLERRPPARRCRRPRARRGRSRRPRRPASPSTVASALRAGCRPGSASSATDGRSSTRRSVGQHRHTSTAAGASRPARSTATCSRSSGSSCPSGGGRNTWPISNSDTPWIGGRLVVGDRLDQAGQQRRAQHRLLGHQRVGELDADRREPAALEVAGREERQRHHLGQPEAPQEPADLAAGLLRGREPAGARRT